VGKWFFRCNMSSVKDVIIATHTFDPKRKWLDYESGRPLDGLCHASNKTRGGVSRHFGSLNFPSTVSDYVGFFNYVAATNRASH